MDLLLLIFQYDYVINVVENTLCVIILIRINLEGCWGVSKYPPVCADVFYEIVFSRKLKTESDKTREKLKWMKLKIDALSLDEIKATTPLFDEKLKFLFILWTMFRWSN